MKILNFLQEIEIQSDMPMVKIGMINSGIRFGITHNYKNTDYSMFMLYGELIGEGLISCVKDYVMKAAGDEFIDDRVIRIFWRCGIVSTVPSGVKNDKDDPQYLVERYRNYLKKQMKQKKL